jgi:crotonobetainyl-CoA:carnitine CoA-transferase CaiB-like acyl-CoA transferase
MAGPLSGVTVLELHRYSPGQFCTMYFADFGADVIKVEEPSGLRFAGESDQARRPTLNRGKRSIVLNLKTDAGREVFLKLARTADVLVEGFRPGVMERLGLGYETLRQVNPRMVYCAISGYGQTGPYRLRAGHDLNYVALGGPLSLTGPKDGAPVPIGIQLGDVAAGGMSAVVGILLALAARERTGAGQFVDISMLDGVVSWLTAQVDGVLAGAPSGRGETVLNGGAGHYGVFETRDGEYVTIGALEPWFWERFCELVGRDDLRPLHGSREEAPRLRREMEQLFRTRTLAEWDALLGDEDVCYAPVLAPLQVLQNEHLRARDTGRTVSEGPAARPVGPTIKLSDTPAAVDAPAPRRGEHTRALLAALGYAADQIGDMYERGICQ